MMIRFFLIVFILFVAISSSPVAAAYSSATSGAVSIYRIYSNERGSPFVYFSNTINNYCSGGNGLYLYDITESAPNWELRDNKMSLLISAKMSGKRVILDYYYDSGINGWASCYIQGVTLVD